MEQYQNGGLMQMFVCDSAFSCLNVYIDVISWCWYLNYMYVEQRYLP